MFVVTLLALFYGGASIEDIFERNGLQYEKIGKTKLIDGSKCPLRRISLLPYVEALTMNEGAEEVDFLILKAQLQHHFDYICHMFDLPTDNSTSPYDTTVISGKPSRILDRSRLEWNVQKYRLDLMTFLTYSKFNVPFYSLIEQDWIDKNIDKDEFSDSTVVIPQRCEAADMTILARLCTNFQAAADTGDLYAIAHAGEMIGNSEVFVYYEVPEYVLVVKEHVIPVVFDSCKAVNGSFILCTEKAKNSCDVATMKSCEIYARSTGADFTFTRRYGNGVVVATNLPKVNVNGSLISADSPVFAYRISARIEKKGADQPTIVETLKSSAAAKVSFPELTREAEEAIRSSAEATRLHLSSRKGVHVLSNQPSKASIWDDLRNFFFHMM